MGKKMKARDAALKAKIAFEAAKGEKTISQLASESIPKQGMNFLKQSTILKIAEMGLA